MLIIVTMHARGRSSSGFQGESRFASVAALFKGLKDFFLPFLRSTDVNSLLVNYKGNLILSQMTHRIDQKRTMRIV